MKSGIDADQLLELVITPTLEELNLYTDAAVHLLLGTAAQESRMGHYIAQIRGPALGIYQMEPTTYRDLWDNFIKFRPELSARMHAVFGPSKALSADRMVYDLKYATAMSRIHYFRIKAALPTSLQGWAAYWKKYYNTPLGKGTEEEFIRNYNELVKGI